MSRNKVFDALDKTFNTVMPTESNPVKPPVLSDKNDVNTDKDFEKRDFRKVRHVIQ